jgi:hypothetical protein
MNDQSNFQSGEMDSDSLFPAPEIMGPRFGIGVTKVAYPERGYQGYLTEPYLLPPYHGRHGSNERTMPGIVQTPLGGMMPSMAVPPPVIHGSVGATMIPGHEPMEFTMGIGDGWPEGCPVPVR